ncbi:MAG TPA: tetratricopeptide repeat protein [Terriglobales bacterium]
MSTNRKTEPTITVWTASQAYTMAVVCLLLGLAVGYLLRGSSAAPLAQAAVATPSAQDLGPAQIPGMGGMPAGQPNTDLADKAVAPMLQALQQNPKDTATLTNIGNTYYDAKIYDKAIQYYAEALKIAPKNVNVRTDMATAYWYLGDADHAVAELEKSLAQEPTHAQSLFNLGIVKWQSRKDPQGAIAAWQKLIQTNPNYPERRNVEQLIERARDHKS